VTILLLLSHEHLWNHHLMRDFRKSHWFHLQAYDLFFRVMKVFILRASTKAILNICGTWMVCEKLMSSFIELRQLLDNVLSLFRIISLLNIKFRRHQLLGVFLNLQAGSLGHLSRANRRHLSRCEGIILVYWRSTCSIKTLFVGCLVKLLMKSVLWRHFIC
jgi:hypothetical protein